MATIALYSNKINNMPRLINDVKRSVGDFKIELSNLKNKSLSINRNICNLDDVISSISACTQIQDPKIDSLESLQRNCEQFIENVVKIDNDVADLVNQRKDDFYNQYSYLKPECEKNGWEKFCDGVKSVGQWCKDHWKLLVTVVLVAVAIAIIVLTAGTTLTLFTQLLIMVAKGILVGSAVGGLIGGVGSAIVGESFFEGFEDGAFAGAISGAISAAMGPFISEGITGVMILARSMLVGGAAESISSLFGDLGDILIKGEDISYDEVVFNLSNALVMGSIFTLINDFIPENVTNKLVIKGINRGNGSWRHVWRTQSTRSLRGDNPIKLKTILKGIGAQTVDEAWDYIFEVIKSITNYMIFDFKFSYPVSNGGVEK